MLDTADKSRVGFDKPASVPQINPELREPGHFKSHTLDVIVRTKTEQSRFEAYWPRTLADQIVSNALQKFEQTGDNYTREHTLRVMELGLRVAIRMGMPDDEIEQFMIGLAVHDLGKLLDRIQLAIYDETDNIDWNSIREHPEASVCMARELGVTGAALGVAGHHHDWRNDPAKRYAARSGVEVRNYAWEKIASAVDAFDAIESERPGHPDIRPREVAFDIVSGDQAVGARITESLGQVVGVLPHQEAVVELGSTALQAV